MIWSSDMVASIPTLCEPNDRTTAFVAGSDRNRLNRSSANVSSRFSNRSSGQTEIDLLESGSTLGPYQVKQILGRGGMGVVFAAYDSRLQRKVAIKTLNAEIAKNKELRQRFESESRAVAAITHPHIVELFDVGNFKDTPYAVMEFLDGELFETVLDRGRLEPSEVRRIGGQIADALATAHEAGVVHRDLKPQNIMLVRTGGSSEAIGDSSGKMVKLFDFGLSRVFDARLSDRETISVADLSQIDHVPTKPTKASKNKTRFGMIMGTPGYMAPEQALGRPVTAATDIFSLGCVLHEAFYGMRAFDGATKSERIESVVRDEPRRDPAIRETDTALAEIIEQCLQKDPSQRPGSGREISRSLEPVEVDSISSRRTFLIAGASGLTVGAATVAAGLLLPDSLDSGDILPSDVKSLAVLSFRDGGRRSDVRSVAQSSPLGIRKLSPGEELAGLLVHELAKSRKLKVPSYRPLVAETPEEFRVLGQQLEVDALLTGTLSELSAAASGATDEGIQPPKLQLDLQLVSARTGNEIWGTRYPLPSEGKPIQQSRIATMIAEVIGDSLVAAAENPPTKNEEAFRCMLDGAIRTDPDSSQGLKMARMCFQKAHDADRGFAKPLAGLALTSVTLAAQSNRKEAIELMGEARTHADAALKIDKMSVEARLADAMLDWQQTQRYENAHMTFKELSVKAENHWQVAHQFGLLQLTLGQYEEAIKSLRSATKLHPFSIFAKSDLIRARWFGGQTERAVNEAIRLAEQFNVDANANGLLVDLYEQQEEFGLADQVQQNFVSNRNRAAASDGNIVVPTLPSEGEYFQRRQASLEFLPYAPYGDVVNRMILSARSGEVDDNQLAGFIDPTTPMTPLALAAHPSLKSLSDRIEVIEILEGTQFV